MNEHPTLRQDTPAWRMYVWISFAVSTGLTGLGIVNMPANFWIKGYLVMGLFFTVGSTFTLAKTLRDHTEGQKLINRFTDAKTERILSEYELRK